MDLKPFQQRVIDEQKDLDIKREKLAFFFHGETFSKLPDDEQSRMSHQAQIMAQYSKVLGERIAAFQT